ncbi:hypothetical protein AURDEDRAFT_184962 [Auricularia subglabra TFB-10046 SS5]|nr:hypothetical protein AURDEDRAFT_184962 [Auricularia subglabra TFB-10046 SS5]
MPSLHGFRSRSRLRCSSRPSTASSDDSIPPPTPSPVPPVPPLPADAAHLQAKHASAAASRESVVTAQSQHSHSHPSLALYPFLANLSRFSGAPGEDIDMWLAGVDAVATHVGAPPDAPVPLIPLLLRGDAFKRFVRVHHDTRGRLTSWEDWKDHLRTEFRGANYLKGKRDELAARSWRTTETLAHYFDARRELQMVVLPQADEDELVQDMLAGVPLRQRRLVTDAIPFAQREEPSLAALRRAMVDCEVEMRGRDRLRNDRLDPTSSSDDARRSYGHRTSKSLGQAPSSGSVPVPVPIPVKWPVAPSAPLSPPLTPRTPPTITVSG